MDKIKWKLNTMVPGDKEASISYLSKEEINKAKRFHESIDGYKETPLIKLDNLAKYMGIKGFYVKDESYRFGLNAFKVLGGSYCMARYLAKRLGKENEELTYKQLISREVKEKLGNVTFYTATDGNHGRGVAWTANKLNQKAVVLMPKGSSLTRLNNIKAEGAEASITDLNYDDAVRLANKMAEENDGVMVQDTAWEGYVDIPTNIMQGYGTMALEAMEQLERYGVKRPTHIFIQAGVGSLAGGIQGIFASEFKENCPITVVVESDLADCYYKSAIANDGKPRFVGGDMATVMAGLACGEPNILGFEVLKNFSSCFISCPDWVSTKGMRILGTPIKGDKQVVSGESGAVTTGTLFEIMTNPELADLKDQLKLDENSEVLVFSTEGDTDPAKYKEIVWNGLITEYDE